MALSFNFSEAALRINVAIIARFQTKSKGVSIGRRPQTGDIKNALALEATLNVISLATLAKLRVRIRPFGIIEEGLVIEQAAKGSGSLISNINDSHGPAGEIIYSISGSARVPPLEAIDLDFLSRANEIELSVSDKPRAFSAGIPSAGTLEADDLNAFLTTSPGGNAIDTAAIKEAEWEIEQA